MDMMSGKTYEKKDNNAFNVSCLLRLYYTFLFYIFFKIVHTLLSASM